MRLTYMSSTCGQGGQGRVGMCLGACVQNIQIRCQTMLTAMARTIRFYHLVYS